MKKVDLILILTIILAITIAIASLSSCTNKYNLALVKRNKVEMTPVKHDESISAMPVISYNKINYPNELNDVQIINEHAPVQASVKESKNDLEMVSIVKEETGIDKNLFNNVVDINSYYPSFNSLTNEQSTTPENESKQDFFLYIILAIFLPPVCVGLWEGGVTTDFWISLILTLCFWIPGVIFALYIILR